MKSIRQLVVETLMRVDARDAWANLALDAQLQQYKLDARDAKFFTSLFYGVLERSVTLDACIAAHSRLAPDKLSPAVREALRCGFYQLLYMDSVPDHAAVAESVALVKKLRKAQAAGYVNGVMRAFLRAEKRIPVPESPLAAKLSVLYSCPEEIVGLWLSSYGEEAATRALAASIGRAPLYIRVNTLLIAQDELVSRLAAHGVRAVPDDLLEDCLIVENTGSVAGLPEYKRGFFHVQDRSSQLAARALEAKPGDRVLDCCAAPGGKTFTLAQLMGGSGEIVACDLHGHRLGLVAARAKKMGLKSVRTQVLDATVPNPALGLFDRVLVDAPCSGLGVIRRKPEIKRKSLAELDTLPAVQYKILETAAHYCKTGGRLVYSTCTLNPAENEQVAQRFLNAHSEFSPAPLPAPLDGEMRTLCGELDADGFFIAAFTRKERA